jgi:hypothetical protein
MTPAFKISRDGFVVRSANGKRLTIEEVRALRGSHATDYVKLVHKSLASYAAEDRIKV